MTVVNFSESDLMELSKKRKKKNEESELNIENDVENGSEVKQQKIDESTPIIDTKSDKNISAPKKDLDEKNKISTQNNEKIAKNDEKNALFSQNLQEKSVNQELLKENDDTKKVENKDEESGKNTNETQIPTSQNISIGDALSKLLDKVNQSNSTLKTDTQESSMNTDSPKQNMLEDLKSQIEGIDNKYDIFPTKGEKMDENINLVRKETLSKTDEELKSEAENSLADYAKAQKDAINSAADKKIENYDGKQESLRKQSELEKAQLQNYYNTYKRNAENDALKRGLQRSSIVINNLNAFDKELVEKLINIDKELGENIATINDEINTLNEERQKALDDFNITYAVKVNDKINALKEDLQAKNDEILEYNNKIAQIEAEYKADAQKRNQQVDEDYMSQIYKYFANQDTIKANKQKEYEVAVDKYLNSLSKADALSELTNNSFIRDILGTNLSYYIYKTKAR